MASSSSFFKSSGTSATLQTSFAISVEQAEAAQVAAAASATSAADSATTASNHASTATNQAVLATTNGSTQVNLATDQVTLATAQVALATTQANNSAASAATASTQAGLATTNGAAQVALATTQASNASSSASTATTKASEASTHSTVSSNFADKITGAVADANGNTTGLYSARAWAIGGTGVTDTAGSGSAKSWAVEADAVDGTEHSAKSYAISGTAIPAGSAKQWAIGGGNSFSTNTAVAGGVYSAKYYAELAAASVDNFQDIYLGAFSSDPTQDGDGDALTAGDLYFSTSAGKLRVYNGSAWNDAVTDTTGFASNGFSIAMSIAL